MVCQWWAHSAERRWQVWQVLLESTKVGPSWEPIPRADFIFLRSYLCICIDCRFALMAKRQICGSFNPMTELNQVLNLYLVQKLFDRWYLICEVKQKTHLSERIDPTFCKQPQGFICRQGYPLCVTIKILARSNASPLEGGVWVMGVGCVDQRSFSCT